MGEFKLIDGRAISESVHLETRQRVAVLKQKNITPGLAFIRVGEDPASRVYVGMKEKKCREIGITSQTHILEKETSGGSLLDLIARLNKDPKIHGILVQAPLPRQLNEAEVFASVLPGKDVDGFHPVNVGKLMLGDPSGFAPWTPAGVQQLLIRSGCPIKGSDVVILGRGNIVGKPLASILMQKSEFADATVTVCHSGTTDLAGHCRRADILIAAIGVPLFVKPDMVKPGAVVIDVGVNRIPDTAARNGSRLVGDVDFEAVKAVSSMMTPNPGGVGPMTIAMLMQNTVRAAEETLLN